MEDIAGNDFYTAVNLESFQQLVILQFWAPWCGPCHGLTETLKRIEESGIYPVSFKRLNVDEYTDIAIQYKVMGVPHTKIFASGFSLDDFSDPLSENEIELFIKNALLTTQILRYSHHNEPENKEFAKALEIDAPASVRKDQYYLTLAKYFLFLDTEKSRKYLELIHDNSNAFEEKIFLKDLFPLLDLDYQTGNTHQKLWSAKNAFLKKDYNSAYQFLLQANRISEAAISDYPRLALLAFRSFLGTNHELNRKYHSQFQSAILPQSGQ